MKKILPVHVLIVFWACAALSLGACSTLQNITGIVTGTTVTPEQAYIAANAFDAVEATATTYLNLPPCATGGPTICRTASAVNAIVPAIRSGRIARNNLEAAVNASGGAPVPATLYQVLQGATSTLQGIIVQYGIKS
jgi:hypothetical protein